MLLPRTLRRYAGWLAAWLALAAGGGALLASQELTRQNDEFQTQARIAHRLLSQRAAQTDAVLQTLALLQPAPGSQALARLPSVYPQILSVARRGEGEAWPLAALPGAEAASRERRHPVLGQADLAAGRAWIVLAAAPASYALQVDLRVALPAGALASGAGAAPLDLGLAWGGQVLPLQAGAANTRGLLLDTRKPLASDSQPFELTAQRRLGWAALPWWAIGGWGAAAAALLAALGAWRRQRSARQRAEELLRLGQVARLNTLGELAAGMAHEVNQPLTAILASTQAARRLLAQEPPELDTAHEALDQAVQQARRASEVVARLRRTVERPDAAHPTGPVLLQEVVRNAFYLLEPEFARRGLMPRLAPGEPVRVTAEPVALEQIVHNLLLNALQALDQVPARERELAVAARSEDGQGVLTVDDSGPGIAPELLPRIFDPFVSTRPGGLGLGLTLCETLAARMGGSLRAAARRPRGAQLRLALPLAGPA